MALFTPTIETPAAQQQVANPVTTGGAASAVEAFAPVAENLVKTGIGFYQKGKLDTALDEIDEELQGLDKTFSNIDDAIKSGSSRKNLQTRARAALNSAKAASPMLADYADELYTKYFGGSGSTKATGTSAFELTPAEEEAEKIQGEIAGYTLLGYSQDQALGILQTKKQGEIAKTQADALANQAKVNMYQVAPTVDALFTSDSVNFQVGLQTAMQEGGGTLSQETKINMTRDIDAWAVTMRQRVQKMLIDPKTGAYKIDPQEATKIFERIEAEVTARKGLLADNSYQKFLTDRKDTLSNEAVVVAHEMYPQLALVRAAGGDQAASTFLDAKLSGNSKLAAWLEKTDPLLRGYLNKDPKSLTQISVKSAEKLFGGQDAQAPVKLSPVEGAVAGDLMASNYTLAVNVLEKAGNLAQVTQHNPSAIAATYNPKVTRIIKGNAKATENVQQMQNGVMNNISSTFRDEFGKFPSGIQVQVDKTDPTAILSSGRPYANIARAMNEEKISVVSTQGDLLTQDITNMVADLYRSVKANPEALPEPLKGFTPEQVVAIWVNSGMSLENITEPVVGVIAEDLGYSYQTQNPRANQPAVKANAGVDTSSGTQVIKTDESVEDYQTVGKEQGSDLPAPTLPTTEEERAAFKEFEAQGLTPEQITAIYGSMQYNEPSIKDVEGTKGGLVDAPITDRAQIARKYAAYLRGE